MSSVSAESTESRTKSEPQISFTYKEFERQNQSVLTLLNIKRISSKTLTEILTEEFTGADTVSEIVTVTHKNIYFSC